MRKYYMHTIGGKPAFFDKDQICYSCDYGANHHNILVTSLKQIRKEQELTEDYRRGKNLRIENDYGYILVYVD